MHPAGLVLALKVDWGNNGFGPGPGSFDAYDDVTSLVISGQGRAGGGDMGRAGGSSTATFVLRDPDGRFWPMNTGSPLYGGLKPGRRVRFTVTHSGGTVAPLFAGYLKSIAPSTAPGQPDTVTLVCEDHIGFIRRRKVSLALQAFQSAGTFRQDILDSIGIIAAYRDLTYAPEDEMVAYASASSDSGMDLLDDLNEATLTRHYITAGTSDTLWFRYVARDRHYGLSGSADTWTDADIADLSGLSLDYDGVVNRQEVDASPYLIQPTQEVWRHPKLPFTLAPSQSVTVYARLGSFTYPIGTLAKGPEGATTRKARKARPTILHGVQAVVTTSGFGGPVTVTTSGYGTAVAVTLTNTSATSAEVITGLALMGQPVMSVEQQDVVQEDAASIAEYGARDGTGITSRYLSSDTYAAGVADHLLFRFRDPLVAPTFIMRNNFPRCLNRNLYDIVTLAISRAHLTATRAEIVSRSWAFDAKGNWETTYGVRQATEDSPAAWFTWGTIMGVSSSPRLGY